MIVANRNHIFVSFVGIVLTVAVLSGLAVLDGKASVRIASVFFISLIAVVGMGVYSGNSGILSFGHLSFMAIGAYASSLLTMKPAIKMATLSKLPPWLIETQIDLPYALVIAVVFVAVIALIIGLVIGRLEDSAAAIATLGLLIVTHGVIIGWKDVTRGAQSFFGVPRESSLLIVAVSCVITLIVARLYRDSVSGLRLRAARENAIAANVSGINYRRERLIAWVISACMMALAGGLLAHFLGAFSPKKFYLVDTFLLLAMLIVGGMSTVSGAVAGALVVTVISEILRRLESGITLFGYDMPLVFGATNIGIGLIILFVMSKRPHGITGFKELEEKLLGALGSHMGSHTSHTPDKTAHNAPKQVLDNVKVASHTPDKAAHNAPENAPKINENHTLTAENITMKFGGLVAVNGVSVQVRPGEILGLIGPNGSGKTTLLNILSGVLTPTAGVVKNRQTTLSGLPIYQFPMHGIARTFQNIRLFKNLSVYQNVLVAGLTVANGQQANAFCVQILQELNLTHKAGLEAGTLSYGDQRRVEIARALALRPSLLFLDEPAAGMNTEETDQLMLILKQLTVDYGIGILLVDHDLKFINALCERIVVLNEGTMIAEGPPKEIQKNREVIKAYIGG